MYGTARTTINSIVNGQKEINLLDRRNRNGGLLSLDQFMVIEMPNFMDYLRSGWAINMSFAIDFTASNGDLSDFNSLHKQDPSGRVMN